MRFDATDFLAGLYGDQPAATVPTPKRQSPGAHAVPAGPDGEPSDRPVV